MTIFKYILIYNDLEGEISNEIQCMIQKDSNLSLVNQLSQEKLLMIQRATNELIFQKKQEIKELKGLVIKRVEQWMEGVCC